ncbi:MAG: PQQ-binding-like beta-propeller repeat protein [Pirellulales bacterium]
MSADRPTVPASERRIWRPWFPLWWMFGVAAVIGSFQFTGFSLDLRNIVKIAGIIVGLVGLSIWFLLSGIGARSLRRIIVGVVWCVLLFAHLFLIDFRNDGAGQLIGWRWGWQAKPDQLLDVPDAKTAISDWQTTFFDYPRFLGAGYWAEATGVDVDPDWDTNPPQEVWRRPIGAGWSAFAIVGDYAVTQEQRGDSELVACYRLSTGEPMWIHADEVRFDPQDLGGNLGGVGPRATPTIHDARVYTHGATGIINCLDARTGEVLWAHDVEQEFDIPPLLWGKSGSPLVIPDLGIVVVNISVPPEASGTEDATGSLTAFDISTGEVRWRGGNLTTSYASPVVCEFGGVRQILQVNEGYLTAYRAEDGKELWNHEWPSSSSGSAACSQPVPLAGDRVFISKGYGHGASLLQIARDDDGRFLATPLWEKPVMKTKLCNVVLRDGYVYGLDDTLLQCVELETGKSMWKKRRSPPFGHGQVLLVGDHLLVTTERGELLLVQCSPTKYRELAAVRVLDEEGVTWNNPALAGPYLLVRNDREAACYRLPMKDESVESVSATD